MKTKQIYYNMGRMDQIAIILAETKNKVKFPDLAKQYKEYYGKEHFSHKWHTND